MSETGFDASFSEGNSEPAEKLEGQPRDESGRFASQAPVESVQPETPAPAEVIPPVPVAPVEPPKAEPGHIPISALLDEREKRQALQRRLDALEAQRQQTEQPSPTFQTPEDIAAYVQREAANAAWSAKIDFSEQTAREKHTDAVVDAAIAWSMAKCEAEKASLGFSPFAVEQMRQRHPVDWVVRQHKRDAFVSEIGDDPEAYRARIRAEIAAEAANQPAPSAPAAASPQLAAPKPPPPRPSLASAPTAGGMQTVPIVSGFDAAFK